MLYRLVFDKKSKSANALKILLLIVGLICDMFAIIGLLFAALGAYIFFALTFVSLIFSIITRVVALKLVYTVEIKLQNGKLTILKVYPNKSKVLLDDTLSNVKATIYDKFDDKIKNINAVNILANEDNCYLVQSQDINLLCNLDKYIYACILKGEEI